MLCMWNASRFPKMQSSFGMQCLPDLTADFTADIAADVAADLSDH